MQLNRKGKLFYFWFISYMIVFFISISVTAISFIISSNIIESEINKATFASLEQCKNIIDNILDSVKKTCYDMQFNEKIITAASYEYPITAIESFNQYEAIKQIQSYGVGNPYIESLFIYNHSSEKVISKTGICSLDIFIQNNLHVKENQYVEFINTLRDTIHASYISVDTGMGNSSRTILFMNPVSQMLTSNSDITIIGKFYMQQLYRAIENLKWMEDSKVFLVDRDNNIVISTEKETKTKDLKMVDFQNMKYGSIETNFNNEEGILFSIDSEVGEFKYVIFIPKRVFLKRINDFKATMFGLLFAGCFISLVLSYFFTIRNYNPLNGIILKLYNVGIINDRYNKNEIRIIESSVDNVIKQIKKSNEWIEKQKEQLRNTFLLKLINGNYRQTELKDILKVYDVKFDYNNFAVLIIYVKNVNDILEDENEKNDVEIQELVRFIIMNIFDELIPSVQFVKYFVDSNQYYCLILNFDDNALESGFKNLNTMFCRGKKVLEEKFGIFILGGLSSSHGEIAELTECYSEAVKSIEHGIMFNKEFTEYDNIKKLNSLCCNQKKYFDFSTEQRMIKFIRIGDINSAKQIIDSIFNSMKNSGDTSLDLARCIVFAIINSLVNILIELSAFSNDEWINRINPTAELISCKNIEEVHDKINKILEETAKYIKRKSSVGKKMEDIRKYIEKNYKDSNLNVSILANEFNMNISYLSNMFKMYIGENVLDYINRVRIKNAKLFLTQSSLNIKEISRIVGYGDSNSFIRVFKKYEGITPGKYRKSKSKKP